MIHRTRSYTREATAPSIRIVDSPGPNPSAAVAGVRPPRRPLNHNQVPGEVSPPLVLGEPCGRCGRNLLEIRKGLSMETLRGAAPLCDIPRCPVVARLVGFRDLASVKGTHVSGPSPPSVFVGRHGYPGVQVGPLLPPGNVDDVGILDSPRDWVDRDISEILGLRSRLLRSKRHADVRDAAHPEGRDPGRVLEATRALAVSSRPVETEVTLEKAVRFDRPPRLDGFAAPMGPSIPVASARVTEHASPARRVDQLVADIHAPAATAVSELAAAGVDADHIQRILSVGLLGERARRRLVPTRWSITATDDMLGKDLIEGVKHLQQAGEVVVHYAEVHGNRFHVLLIPAAWSFDMTEVWQQEGGFAWASDWEDHRGRSGYAANVTGAYYSARLAVLEHLRDRVKRQAAAIVFREITEAYWAPLGVWVIREGVRRAMSQPPIAFSDTASAVQHVTGQAIAKDWVTRSALLDRLMRQRTLFDFV